MTLRQRYNELLAENQQLTNDLEMAKQDLASCLSGSAMKDHTIQEQQQTIQGLQAALAVSDQALKDCEGQLDGWTETLRDTDGHTLNQAISALGEGDKLRLVGDFKVTQEIHFPSNGITVGCEPGEARVEGVNVPDVFGMKVAPGKGAENVTLLNLDISGGTNCVVGWFGTTLKGCRLHGGLMTGFHAFTDGSPRDADILLEDCELDHNGSLAEVGHGAAGSKVYNTHGVTYRRVHSHHNTGNGLWADYHCGRVEYLDCVMEENTVRGAFYEKCGREGKPYPDTFYYGMYLDDFTAKGGKVVYEGAWNIVGCTIQNNHGGNEGVLFVASVHFRLSDTTFGGNAKGVAVTVRNDPNRMYPTARTKTPPTKPGWMVEDVVLEGSTCTLNGDEILIANNVPADKVMVT